MKHYELTCLLSSKLTEEEIKKFSEEIISFIQEKKGILERGFLKDKAVKQRLFSSIKEESEAYLNTLDFQFLPEEIEWLKTKLNSKKQILRYTILVKKSLKEVKIPKTLPKVPAAEKTAKPLSEKVDLKEIEKKLEEILDE